MSSAGSANLNPLGPRLKAARQAAGLTQAAVAGRLGVTQQAVAQFERPAANLTLQTLAAYAAAVGADPATFDDRLAKRKGRKRR